MGPDLLTLALRRDAAARDELAERLAALKDAPSLDRRARIELEALLRELRPGVSSRMRDIIDASLVAAQSGARRSAQPRREPVASDDVAAELAMSCEAERLVAIARRPDLPLRVSRIVAARGHLPALHALAGNRSAAIGHSVLVALADLALGDPGLRSLVIRRHDLPEEAMSLLWPHLPNEDRATMLRAAAPYAEEDLDEIAHEAELRLHEALRQGELPASLDSLRDAVERGRKGVDGVVADLAHEARFADLGEFLARHLGYDLLPLLNLLAMASPRGTALLCRAAGLASGSYDAIAMMRRELGWQAPAAMATGIEAFDGLSASAARRLLALYAEDEAR
jgi:uncharacterized protein (DUF2336 family)